MPGPPRRGIRLPKQLLEQLDVNVPVPRQGGPRHPGRSTRKANRKAARIQKKAGHARQRGPTRGQKIHDRAAPKDGLASRSGSIRSISPDSSLVASESEGYLSKDEASSSMEDVDTSPLEPERHATVPREAQMKLDEDDAAIATLERKLGIQNRKQLPKSFEDDGLLELLGGIHEPQASDGANKYADNDSQVWLAGKRKKALLKDREREKSESEFSGFSGSEDDCPNRSPRKIKGISRIGSEANKSTKSLNDAVLGSKLGHVSLQPEFISKEASQHLRRAVRGLFNRLSEPNLLSLLAEIESLVQGNPRQFVFTVLLDSILDQIGGPDALSEAFIILYAGLIAAIYKTVGSDFGANAVQRICESLETDLEGREANSEKEKSTVNLITVLTHLFTLGVISSELVYDFVRKFVGIISESNTQLLLRILKSSGLQLLQEDPSSLKEIVTHLQSSVARQPPGQISVRTKFMMETIVDLKNNKTKTGVKSSSIALAHLDRMKKILGSIGQHRIKATEPLRITLAELHDDNKQSLWWLAGAKQQTVTEGSEALSAEVEAERHRTGGPDDMQDIIHLASEQRMNTDIRRSVFINLMSASDCQDAYQRLVGLGLSKVQKQEIPKVLIHCAAAEEHYNPYYTLVADLLCSSRRMKISMQMVLWDTLKRIEHEAPEDEPGREPSGPSKLRSTIHLAKMYGELVSKQKLDIKLIKNVQLEGTREQTAAFLEVFFLTICLRAQRHKRRDRLEQNLSHIFQPLSEDYAKAHSVRRFFAGTLRNSDMVVTAAERDRLDLCCDIVERTLQDQTDG